MKEQSYKRKLESSTIRSNEQDNEESNKNFNHPYFFVSFGYMLVVSQLQINLELFEVRLKNWVCRGAC